MTRTGSLTRTLLSSLPLILFFALTLALGVVSLMMIPLVERTGDGDLSALLPLSLLALVLLALNLVSSLISFLTTFLSGPPPSPADRDPNEVKPLVALAIKFIATVVLMSVIVLMDPLARLNELRDFDLFALPRLLFLALLYPMAAAFVMAGLTGWGSVDEPDDRNPAPGSLRSRVGKVGLVLLWGSSLLVLLLAVLGLDGRFVWYPAGSFALGFVLVTICYPGGWVEGAGGAGGGDGGGGGE
ncbi:hypothetical protein ACIQFP_12300 [Nocardiopsis alba]|uniref:hypothetical protein n=1 Tax=Nocardiopsis alba TaxID=53437 RepID=UPI0038210E97